MGVLWDDFTASVCSASAEMLASSPFIDARMAASLADFRSELQREATRQLNFWLCPSSEAKQHGHAAGCWPVRCMCLLTTVLAGKRPEQVATRGQIQEQQRRRGCSMVTGHTHRRQLRICCLRQRPA